jgi:ABC-type uncharacterized transport system YnjBCD permease subunit
VSPLQGLLLGFVIIVLAAPFVLLAWVQIAKWQARSNLGRERATGPRRP